MAETFEASGLYANKRRVDFLLDAAWRCSLRRRLRQVRGCNGRRRGETVRGGRAIDGVEGRSSVDRVGIGVLALARVICERQVYRRLVFVPSKGRAFAR